MTSNEFICLIHDTVTTFTYYRTCPKNYICKENFIESQKKKIFICESEFPQKDEGSNCILDYDCKTLHCKDNQCVTLTDGEKCESHFECAKDSVCKNGTCTKLSKEGEPCEWDSLCFAGYVCGKNQKDNPNICVLKYSIKNNNYASRREMCESGTSIDDICYDVESKVSEGTTCVSNEDCKGTIIRGESKTDINLSCLFTWNDKRVCEYGTKSSSWITFINYYKKEMKRKNASILHTLPKRGEYKITNDITINKYYLQTIGYFYNAPTCLLEALAFCKRIHFSLVTSSIFIAYLI